MFFAFFIINLLSNAAFLFGYCSLWTIVGVVIMAGFLAAMEDLLVRLFSSKTLQDIIICTIFFFHSLFLLVDYFLLAYFGFFYHQELTELLCETDSSQAKEFIHSYCSLDSICCWIVAIAAVILFACFLNRKMKRLSFKNIQTAFSVFGICLILISLFSSHVYANGLSVSQFSAPIRFAHTGVVIKQRQLEIRNLKKANLEVKASADIDAAPSIVLVIGESFSKYHCSLYGYQLPTYPRLQKRLTNGELCLMDDAVAPGDLTHICMKAIFSVGDGYTDFKNQPLFPSIFKQAGYRTKMYDAQYLPGNGISFMSDKELSKELFEERSSKDYLYDGDMVDEIVVDTLPSLYVVHLWGQHFDYSERYPLSFQYFSEKDYSQQEHAATIAQYDNASLYNDFVVDRLFEKFENEDVIVVYLSDHGEEVYELGHLGHVSAMTTVDIRYQLSVPFMVWMSSEFSELHPEKMEQIRKAQQFPILTRDVCHFLMDIAGIESEWYHPDLSFVNSNYDSKKTRITLYCVDYDKKVKEYE